MIIPIVQIDYAYTRSRVPGGWFVHCVPTHEECLKGGAYLERTYFYPDPHHNWDGYVSWNDKMMEEMDA